MPAWTPCVAVAGAAPPCALGSGASGASHCCPLTASPLLPPPRFLYLQYLVTQCHVYDEDVNYVPFDFAKEEAFFAAQRKFLPN